MSEQKFKEARGQLAFSQNLVDKMRAPQTPDMNQGMAQNVAQPQPQAATPQPPEPQPTPQPEVAQPASVASVAPSSGESMQNAFRQITQAFAKGEEKKAKETQDLEKKFTTELKGLKENIRKIVEE